MHSGRVSMISMTPRVSLTTRDTGGRTGTDGAAVSTVCPLHTGAAAPGAAAVLRTRKVRPADGASTTPTPDSSVPHSVAVRVRLPTARPERSEGGTAARPARSCHARCSSAATRSGPTASSNVARLISSAVTAPLASTVAARRPGPCSARSPRHWCRVTRSTILASALSDALLQHSTDPSTSTKKVLPSSPCSHSACPSAKGLRTMRSKTNCSSQDMRGARTSTFRSAPSTSPMSMLARAAFRSRRSRNRSSPSVCATTVAALGLLYSRPISPKLGGSSPSSTWYVCTSSGMAPGSGAMSTLSFPCWTMKKPVPGSPSAGARQETHMMLEVTAEQRLCSS